MEGILEVLNQDFQHKKHLEELKRQEEEENKRREEERLI
jgi:hypothetical protein